MSESYNVVFTGELLDGYDLKSFQKAFADIFKLSQDKVQNYLTGQPKVLKKDVSHEVATKYKSRIESVGGKVKIHKSLVMDEPKAVVNTDANDVKQPEPVKVQKSRKVLEKIESINSPDVIPNIQHDDSLNAIERGRLNQVRKLEAIEFAEDKNSKILMVLGIIFIIFGVLDLALNFLNIYSLTDIAAISISSILIGLIFLKSRKAN